MPPHRAQPRRRLVAIADLLRMRIPGDAQVSPDGSRILFTQREASATRPGEYERSLWTVATGVGAGPGGGLGGGSASGVGTAAGAARAVERRQGRRGDRQIGLPHRFTAGPRDGGGRWSPDGARVAFIRAQPRERPQLWTIAAGGGEAQRLTDFPEGHIASFKWSPDGSQLAVSFRATMGPATDSAAKARRERGESEPPHVLDDIWYRLDGDGYFGSARHVLHVVDARNGRARVLFDRDTNGDFSYDWSPDGSMLAITANTSPRASFEPWMDGIHLVRVDDGRVFAVSGAPEGPKSAIAWSPDGRSLAWAGREDSHDGLYSPHNLHLWVATIDGLAGRGAAKRGSPAASPRLGPPRCLTIREDACLMGAILSDSADALFAPVVLWHPDSTRIVTRIGRHGIGHLASIQVDGDAALRLLTRDGDRSIGNFSADGAALALVRLSPMSPPEVSVARLAVQRGAGRAATRGPASGAFREHILTALNAELVAGLRLAAPESRWIVAEDGQRSQVWVLRPPDAGPRRKTPAILMVHGGPHAMYGEVFFHEMQLMAALGYTVLMGNPRGSKGYGERFCAAIRGAWGEKDWLDVQGYLRHLQSDPAIDSRRIAIAGGSYGGYMTNWAIGHSHAFRCAITDRCVCNLLSMAGNSDYPDSGDYWPGHVWDRWEARWEMSPIKHFKDVRTPTLVIHSEGDLRCNVEQGEQVFSALSALGVPTRFVRYPASTSHGMSRGGPPDLRMHRLREMESWFARWLRGGSPRKGKRARSLT